MNYNKIMTICWFYIIGVVVATMYSVHVEKVPYLGGIFGLLVIVGMVLFIFSNKGFNITYTPIMIAFLLAACILGFTRYTAKFNLNDKNHISNFVSENFKDPDKEFTFKCKIISEPEVFYDKTRLEVQPLEVTLKNGDKKKISGGNIKIQIRKEAFRKPVEEWRIFSKPEVYGAIIQFTGNIVKPMHRNNPGGWSSKEFLQAQNFFGTVYNFDNLEIVNKNPAEWYDAWHWLTVFSLNLKRKMLWIFKETMPFPESAFLGGVTLGLRRGLESKPCFLNNYYKYMKKSFFEDDKQILHNYMYKYNERTEDCNYNISDEFRWAGVSHVLAVSGLHVTIITLFLYAVFNILKVPPKIFAPIMVFALVVFTIITGARPSTIRAAIMNSIGVLTFVYSKRGFRASALFAIATAGFLILLDNPLLIYAPSLTLSFGAVLSLVLITGPVDRVLSDLKGLPFVWFLIIICIITFLVNYDWFLLTNPAFYLPFGIFAIALSMFFKRIDEQYPIFGSWGYHSIPNGARQFFAAQFGIQFGMMIPLSAYYFGRYPIAGAYANFIAIPLIGIIVQLGILAGLLGIVFSFISSTLGLWIALCLNATNWALCLMFLGLAHISTKIFIYPHVTNWTEGRLLLYYICIGIFIWRDALFKKLEELCYRLNIPTIGPASTKFKVGGSIFALIVLIAMIFATTHDNPKGTEVTILDLRYSTANTIQFPNGKAILMNGSHKNQPNYLNPYKKFDSGNRGVFSFLKKKGIIKLDSVILTSLNEEFMSGLIEILRYADIDKYYDQLDPKLINPLVAAYPQFKQVQYDIARAKEKIEFYTAAKNKTEVGKYNRELTRLQKKYDRLEEKLVAGFFRAVGDDYYTRNYKKFYIQKMFYSYMDNMEVLYDRGIPHYQARKKVIAYKETIDGKKTMVYFLNPPEKGINRGSEDDNSVVVRLQYGKQSMLFTGTIHEKGIERLSRMGRQYVQADVIAMPEHGMQILPRMIKAKGSIYNRLVDSVVNMNKELLTRIVRPRIVTVDYDWPKEIYNRGTRKFDDAWNDALLPFYKKYTSSKGRKLFATARDHAITITFDGTTIPTVVTQREVNEKELKIQEEYKEGYTGEKQDQSVGDIETQRY